MLQSLDLEPHNINPQSGLYFGLEELGDAHRMLTDEQIENATKLPPQNTRAKGRAEVISQLIAHKWGRYLIDWDWVRVDKDRHLELRNPFHTYETEATAFTKSLSW